MLHGGVFAIGLDGGELLLELGEAALVERGVFFQGAAGVVAVFEPVPRGFERRLRVGETSVGLGQTLRLRGYRVPSIVDPGIEVLERDQAIEVGEHHRMQKSKFKMQTKRR